MTMPERLKNTEREKADGEAVLRNAFHGEPLDPEVAPQVRERRAEITEEICREHGEHGPDRGLLLAKRSQHAPIPDGLVSRQLRAADGFYHGSPTIRLREREEMPEIDLSQ
jgi:hypothetical protein